MESPDAAIDLRPTTSVPSVLEIAGLIFAALPFVLSGSTTRTTVVNDVATVVYRDPVALTGAAVAAGCAVFSAIALRRTERTRRVWRLAVFAILLGLAVLQLLRGIGTLGGPESTHASTQTYSSIDRPAPPPIDTIDTGAPTKEPTKLGLAAATMTRELMELWKARAFDTMSSRWDVEPREEAISLGDTHSVLEEAAGKFLGLGDKPRIDEVDGWVFVVVDALHDRGTLTYRLAFRVVDQELRAHKFEFRVPDELRRKPALNDGDAIARKLVDALLLGTIETSLLDPLTVVRLTDDFTKRLTEVRAALGPVTSVGTPARNDECKRTHCVSIEVTGAKQRALFKVELDHVVVRWRVWKVEFSLIE